MNSSPASAPSGRPRKRKFPPLFWLAIVFEFFERGSYYGMMSVLSVYLTDELRFSKPDVGVIKATIQPLLYFLPILAGAVADRFGFRRTLMVAFALLGGGYFLTSQTREYATVFLSLVVMGLGAGAFKPIISGTIARCTDEATSSLGFGIYYWSINLGAFVVPTLLVPWLRSSFGWQWVILASAIGTGAMLLPALLLFREPPAPAPAPEAAAQPKPGLLQTLATAFEIIYSPFVLARAAAARSRAGLALVALGAAALLGYGALGFSRAPEKSALVAAPAYRVGEATLVVRAKRNLSKPKPWTIKRDGARVLLELHDPDRLAAHAAPLLVELRRERGLGAVDRALLERARAELDHKVELRVGFAALSGAPWQVVAERPGACRLQLASCEAYRAQRAAVLAALRRQPGLGGLAGDELDELVARAGERPFLALFIALLFLASQGVLALARRFQALTAGGRVLLGTGTVALLAGGLFLIPHLSLFARVLSSVIAATVVSLYAIDTRELARFRDHIRFLTMIFIYSGFWVLYFQMFDSVLWYVQAYVDASSLDRAVNAMLAALGVDARFRFDVENVTTINAGAIILLQLLVSALVRKTRALPTMIAGICLGTIGMAILAISTGIWVFILGIAIFSIGEMTAHPKFIAYVGLTAPRSRVALYMGYLFLYGVIGAGIGGVVGANLYVKLVDELNRPRTLWLIFASIGAATVVALLVYDRLLARRRSVIPSKDT
jgi:dipeptide/tripeptide permease